MPGKLLAPTFPCAFKIPSLNVGLSAYSLPPKLNFQLSFRLLTMRLSCEKEGSEITSNSNAVRIFVLNFFINSMFYHTRLIPGILWHYFG